MSKKPNMKKDKARKERIRKEKHVQRVSKDQQSRLEKSLNIKRRVTLPNLITQEMFSDQQHQFWAAHGVNFIVSDHETGVWEPMFPDIYNGKALTFAEIAEAVVQKFGTSGREWDERGKAALAWTSTPREAIYIYYRECIRRQRVKTPEGDVEALIKSPHNPVVWEVMHYMMSSMRKGK